MQPSALANSGHTPLVQRWFNDFEIVRQQACEAKLSLSITCHNECHTFVKHHTCKVKAVASFMSSPSYLAKKHPNTATKAKLSWPFVLVQLKAAIAGC